MSDNAESLHLARLVGHDVSSIVFVRDYVQLTFESDKSSFRLTCFTMPTVTMSGTTTKLGQPKYRDALCDLIDKVVQSATERPRDTLAINFNSGACLNVSSRPEDAHGPEVAMLTDEPSGKFCVVWQ